MVLVTMVSMSMVIMPVVVVLATILLNCFVFVVPMRASTMSSVGVVMEDTKNDNVANQSKDACDKHIDWFLNWVFFNHSVGCLNEELDCHNVDEDDIEEGAERLCLFPTESEIKRAFTNTQPNRDERNDVCEHVREQMERVRPDSDRMGHVPSD